MNKSMRFTANPGGGCGRWLIPFILTSSLIFGSQSADTSHAEKIPGKAVLFSLFPGGGQIYNGKYVKAIVILTMEIYFVYHFQKNRVAYNDWDSDSNSSPRYRYRDKRNKYAWWIGFTYVYNLLDALADSHLASFDFEISDEEKTKNDNGD